MTDDKNSDELMPLDLVNAALESRYPQSEENLTVLESEELIDFLLNVEVTDPQDPEGHLRTNILPNLLAQLELQHPTSCLSNSDFAVLSFLDECADQIAVQAKLDSKIQALVLTTFPALMKEVLTAGLVPTLQNSSILTIQDLISGHCIGWTSGLGKVGEKLHKKIQSTVKSLNAKDADYPLLLEDLVSYFHKKSGRIRKLEKRLAESETGILRVQRAQHFAAEMINTEVAGKKISVSVGKFLSGLWCDALQFLLIHHGHESDEWQRARKLTERLVWTTQPIDGKDEESLQKLYRLTEQLPNEIHKLLTDLEYANESVEVSLAELEAEHINIMTGLGMKYDDFTPLDYEDDLFNSSIMVSHLLLDQVNHLKPGQWFLFEQSNGRTIRIKLILKLDDVHQLLFTNNNGVKALQKGFEKFAYFLSSNAAEMLPVKPPFQTTVKSKLKQVVDEYNVQQKRLEAAKNQAEKDDIMREIVRKREIIEAKSSARRSKATQRHREAAARRELLKKAKQEADREANREKLEQARISVQSLNIGAWILQSGEEISETECRLALKLETEDKFIFTDQSSVKVGEYNTDELTQELALGGWEILDSGDDVEDTLLKVVTRLRQDRN